MVGFSSRNGKPLPISGDKHLNQPEQYIFTKLWPWEYAHIFKACFLYICVDEKITILFLFKQLEEHTAFKLWL